MRKYKNYQYLIQINYYIIIKINKLEELKFFYFSPM